MNDLPGYSLIEGLISICIIATISMMGYQYFSPRDTNFLKHDVEQIITLLNKSRQSALNLQKNIVICSSNHQVKCQKNQHMGLLAFIDENHNHQHDPHEKILDHIEFQTPGIRIEKKIFSPFNIIQFSPKIHHGQPSGHLKVMAPNQTQHKIILSPQGRDRKTMSKD